MTFASELLCKIFTTTGEKSLEDELNFIVVMCQLLFSKAKQKKPENQRVEIMHT